MKLSLSLLLFFFLIAFPLVTAISWSGGIQGTVNATDLWITDQGVMDNVPDLYPTLITAGFNNSGIDTNVTTICSGGTVLLGNGTCATSNELVTVTSGNIFDQWLNISSNVSHDDMNVTGDLFVQRYRTTGTGKMFNFFDNSKNGIIVNFSSTDNNVTIEGKNAQIRLFNPTAQNDWRAVSLEGTIGGTDTAFIVHRAGTGRSTYNARSFRIGGDVGADCDLLTSDVDCDTSATGADLAVQDDGWFGGKVIARDTINSSTEVYVNNATAVSPWLYNYTQVPTPNNSSLLSINNITNLNNIQENIVVTGNNNITTGDRVCLNSACTSYIFTNASHSIWK